MLDAALTYPPAVKNLVEFDAHPGFLRAAVELPKSIESPAD